MLRSKYPPVVQVPLFHLVQIDALNYSNNVKNGKDVFGMGRKIIKLYLDPVYFNEALHGFRSSGCSIKFLVRVLNQVPDFEI